MRSGSGLPVISMIQLAEMRNMLQALRLSNITDMEIDLLVEELAAIVMGHTSINVLVKVDLQHPFPKAIQEQVYRICQEALNNVVKHARATEVHIHLLSQPEQMRLSIKDNGRGFDQHQTAAKSLGLGIMQERAKEINALVEVKSEINLGTEVLLCWLVTPSA